MRLSASIRHMALATMGSALLGCASAPEPFTFCQADPSRGNITLDYEQREGVWVDVRAPIKTCGSARSGCIAFPFLISAPPRLPEQGELVKWSVEAARFEITRADRPNEFLLTAYADTGAGSDPVTAPSEEYRYRYDQDLGVVRMVVGSEQRAEDAWERCSGSLTFEKLSAITQ